MTGLNPKKEGHGEGNEPAKRLGGIPFWRLVACLCRATEAAAPEAAEAATVISRPCSPRQNLAPDITRK
jgi:hypothetical protein